MIATRFKSKPCEIEAVRYDGSNAKEIHSWMGTTDGTWNTMAGHLNIVTLEGTMFAQPGDWIVRGLKGEFYPVKPDIMDMKYEKIT